VLIKDDGRPREPGWFAKMEDDYKVGTLALLAVVVVAVTIGACASSCLSTQKEICVEAIKSGNADAIKFACPRVGNPP
jgi:hypothetical protein